MEDSGGRSVEVHVFGGFMSREFYGETLSAVPVGFLRPEMKFDGIGELLAQIKADISLANNLLVEPKAQEYKKLMP